MSYVLTYLAGVLTPLAIIDYRRFARDRRARIGDGRGNP